MHFNFAASGTGIFVSVCVRSSGNRRRIKDAQIVMKLVLFCKALLFPAGYRYNFIEKLRADLPDGRVSRSHRPGVHVDQVLEHTLITGAAARPYGVPLPVMNTCRVIPEASWHGPHTISLAGVAA